MIDELGWPYVERYLALRKSKRIGPVWPGVAGVYWIAPLDAFDAHGQLEPIPVPKLRDLIDELDPPQIESNPETAHFKKPVQSARGTRFGERRRA